MKNKLGLRSILATLLILSSVCSYIYLNTVQLIDSQTTTTQVQKLSIEQEIEQEVLLPDVEILKTIIEKSRHSISF